MTSFGGNFLQAPNPIDFDKVFTEFGNLAESGNISVLVTICCAFLLYFVVIVVARRADTRDESKASYYLLRTQNRPNRSCVGGLYLQRGRSSRHLTQLVVDTFQDLGLNLTSSFMHKDLYVFLRKRERQLILCKQLLLSDHVIIPGGNPDNGLYEKVPPERGTCGGRR